MPPPPWLPGSSSPSPMPPQQSTALLKVYVRNALLIYFTKCSRAPPAFGTSIKPSIHTQHGVLYMSIQVTSNNVIGHSHRLLLRSKRALNHHCLIAAQHRGSLHVSASGTLAG